METTTLIFFLVKNYGIELAGDDKIKLTVPVNKTEKTEKTKKNIELIKEHKAEIIDFLNQEKAKAERIAQLREQHKDILAKLEKQTNKHHVESALHRIAKGADPEAACKDERIVYANYPEWN